MALQTAVFSRHGVRRAIRWAFELARREGRGVTSVSKGNALQYSGVLWDEVFAEVSAEYPDVGTDELLVDAVAEQPTATTCFLQPLVDRSNDREIAAMLAWRRAIDTPGGAS